jgi:hypothetical protein
VWSSRPQGPVSWRPYRSETRDQFLRRTLMRPPVVKRQTPPQSGLLTFFPLGWARRSRHPGTRSGLMAVCWGKRYVSAPPTYGGSTAIEMTMAERRGTGLGDLATSRDPHTVLRQRAAARLPCASEGQVRGRGSPRPRSGACAACTGTGAGVHASAPGQAKAPMGAWAFADAGSQQGRARSPGSSCGAPVRPPARPRRALTRGGTAPSRTPSLV